SGTIHRSDEPSANPVHSSKLPTYNGFLVCAYGPLVTSGPRRVVRVRDTTPMCRTAQRRSASPATMKSAPTYTRCQSMAVGAKTTAATPSGTGSHDRLRNTQWPTDV